MKLKPFLFIFLILSICCGCCDDDEMAFCDSSIRGVDSFLDSESKSYLQNYLEHDLIFFLDNDSDTVVFEVVNRVDTLIPYSEFTPCLVDSTQNQIRNGFFQLQYATLYSGDLDLFFYLRLINQSTTDIIVNDNLWIAKGNTLEFNLPDVVNGSNFLSEYSTHSPIGNVENPFVVEHDSMEIGGKVFYNLIEPNPSNTGLPNGAFPNPLVKYTKELGLVSINDNTNGTHFVYCGSE